MTRGKIEGAVQKPTMKPLRQLSLTPPLAGEALTHPIGAHRVVSPNRGGFERSPFVRCTKVPLIGVPGEAQRKYPQGVCRIRSAAKLLTAALLGSVGKGGDAQ